MKSALRYYNKICVPKYQSLGFYKNNATLVRNKGNILQSFTFKQTKRSQTCSVEFGFFPMCMPTPIFLDTGGYELGAFDVDTLLCGSEWRYSSNEINSIIECVEAISTCLDTHLIPLFDKCNSCEETLNELLRLEELFDTNRKAALHLVGDSDCASHWLERSMFDSKKYYMALKSHNMSYAKRYLCYQVNYYKNKLDFFESASSPAQPTRVIERFHNQLSLYSEHLEKLTSGNFDFFDEMLNFNECQMLNYIASQYPKLSSNL